MDGWIFEGGDGPKRPIGHISPFNVVKMMAKGKRRKIKGIRMNSLFVNIFINSNLVKFIKMRALFFIFLVILANSALSCRHNGVTYRNGDEWMERNAFVMRCTIYPNGSWRTEVVACTLPDGRRVPINTAIEDGNDEWRCEMNEQGMVTLVQGANPNARCDGRPVGSVWREKSFELECRPGGYRRLVGCVTEDGQRIPVNGTREVNGFTMVCQQFHNGTVIFHGTKSVRPSDIQRYGQPMYPQYGSSSSSDSSPSNGGGSSIRCNDENGYARNVGEYWVENHRFNKTCRPNGAVEVANCVSKDGYRIPLNGQLIRDGAKYSCEMTPQGTIRFAAGPVDE